ncbi:MAG: hypothetical protein ACRBCJ_13530 [Hyphomicrobiaceae bacterium]
MSTTTWLLIVALLLCFLVGPNFGPVPLALSGQTSFELSVLALLASFAVGFSVIIYFAFVSEKFGAVAFRSWLKDQALLAAAGITPVIVGAIFGIVWGAVTLMSAQQLRPQLDIWHVDGFRVGVGVFAAAALSWRIS